MQNRKLKLTAEVMGMVFPIGVVTISTYSQERKTEVDRFCPECGEKPDWVGYRCSKCSEEYSHWSRLKAYIKGTLKPFVMERLIPKTKGYVPEAHLFKMDRAEFGSRYSVITKAPHPLVPEDENTAVNLSKLAIAVQRMGFVIVVRWDEAYQQNIGLLDVSMSNDLVIQEIIPENLAVRKGVTTIKVDPETSDEDVEGAKMLLGNIPLASEETFIVSDYRTQGLEEPAKVESPKVMELSAILAKAKAKA